MLISFNNHKGGYKIKVKITMNSHPRWDKRQCFSTMPSMLLWPNCLWGVPLLVGMNREYYDTVLFCNYLQIILLVCFAKFVLSKLFWILSTSFILTPPLWSWSHFPMASNITIWHFEHMKCLLSNWCWNVEVVKLEREVNNLEINKLNSLINNFRKAQNS